MPAKSKPALSNAQCKRRALLACDWFVNTQIVSVEPAHDANHGRVIYNYHPKTGLLCRGLSWSQGRAIMCLLAGHAVSGKDVYLQAAERCASYLVHALQRTDGRNRRTCGAFAEEVPQSDFCYPRDGIEAAAGLLQLHMVTGDPLYLDRAELFAKWYLANAYDSDEKWVRGRVGFYDDEDRVKFSFIQAGGAPLFWHLHQATGNARYRTMTRQLGQGILDRFFDHATGQITSGKKGKGTGHHTAAITGREMVVNDDGSVIGLSCAHAATGKKTSKFLDAMLANCDWLMSECPRPTPSFAATGLHAINLTEATRLTGEKKYADFARGLMAEQVKLQVEAPKKPDRHGGYRGEDEPAQAYVKGSTGKEFLTTRTTAYATLALFRLHGDAHGPSYSALGFRKPPK